jgi:hypothetical protein
VTALPVRAGESYSDAIIGVARADGPALQSRPRPSLRVKWPRPLIPLLSRVAAIKLDLAKFLNLERVEGIEPSYSAWKAAALPLSYTRDFNSSSCFSTYRWHVSGTEIRAVLTESSLVAQGFHDNGFDIVASARQGQKLPFAPAGRWAGMVMAGRKALELR